MANEEHLEILRQGVEVWNRWREQNPGARPALVAASLLVADLRGANFSEAYLMAANLSEADLSEADLSEANLYNADFSGANLSKTNLSKTNLNLTNLSRVKLSGADFSHARVGDTTFGNVDLRAVRGLETVDHIGPSTIGIDTIYRSAGQIPESFLRGAGVPEALIKYFNKSQSSSSPYTQEQIDYWLGNLQKRLFIVLKTIARLEEKKALAGPINVPLQILNELDEYEAERAKVEDQIIEFKDLKNAL